MPSKAQQSKRLRAAVAPSSEMLFVLLVRAGLWLGRTRARDLILDRAPILAWRRTDPDAATGHAPAHHPCPLLRGYRLHTLLCRGSGLPLLFQLSPANVHDAPFARPLLELAVRLFAVRPCWIRLDAGYWGLKLIAWIHTVLGVPALHKYSSPTGQRIVRCYVILSASAAVHMEPKRRRMMMSAWNIWLQRLLVTAILLVTAAGLGLVGLVWVTPSLEASLVPAAPPRAVSPSLAHTAPATGTPPATPTPARAPAQETAPTSQPSVLEVQKVVLAGQSMDGPALWLRPPSATPGSTNPVAGALAWTDISRYHRLHLMTSTDGLHFDHELLLPANAIARPSVVVATIAKMPGTAPADVVILAWTGTDPTHHLNVMYDALGAQRVLTLPQSSLDAPALALFGGQLWLAWTGTEGSHPLHIVALALETQGVVPGTQALLGAYQSLTAPSLTTDEQQHQLILTWTAAASRLSLAASSDGIHWSLAPNPLPSQASSASSAILAPFSARASQAGSTTPSYYWAWPGTDRWHAIKLTLAPTLHEW